jgi:hypothetical protein
MYTTETNHSAERRIAQALAATPAPAVDPIFALIAEYTRLDAECDAVHKRANAPDRPKGMALQEEFNKAEKLSGAARDAFMAVYHARAITIGGAMAQLSLMLRELIELEGERSRELKGARNAFETLARLLGEGRHHG